MIYCIIVLRSYTKQRLLLSSKNNYHIRSNHLTVPLGRIPLGFACVMIDVVLFPGGLVGPDLPAWG